MKDLKAIFPRASDAFLRANRQAFVEIAEMFDRHDNKTTASANSVRLRATTAKGMNATERSFALLLEAMKNKGEILRYEFEALRLRWGDTMFYKPDFLLVPLDDAELVRLVEVKGAHIWDRDLVRFKGCKAEWKDCFTFELHQKTRDGWTRIL